MADAPTSDAPTADSPSEHSPTADSLSWDLGPKNSRVVRLLLYFAYGSFGSVGVLFLVLVGSVLRSMADSALRSNGFGSRDGLFTVGILSLAFLLAVRRVLPVALARRSGGFATDLSREFAEVRRLRWIAVASLLAFGGFAGAVLTTEIPVLALLLPIVGWMTGSMLAHLLSSSGEVDPGTRTLTYDEQDVDIDFLAGTRQFAVGGRTFLWLSFEPGYAGFDRRLYVLPTPVAERAWPVFEAGVVREVEPEGAEAARTKRRRYVLGALALFLGGFGVFALFWWVDAPLAIAGLAGAIVGVFGLALLDAALRVA